jgi:hypothetical protein
VERVAARCGRLLADEFHMRRVFEARRENGSWFLAWFAMVGATSHALLATVFVDKREVLFNMFAVEAECGAGGGEALAAALKHAHLALNNLARKAIALRTDIVAQAVFAEKSASACAIALEFGALAGPRRRRTDRRRAGWQAASWTWPRPRPRW